MSKHNALLTLESHRPIGTFTNDVLTLSGIIVEIISLEVGSQYKDLIARNSNTYMPSHDRNIINVGGQGYSLNLSDLGHGINPYLMDIGVKVSLINGGDIPQNHTVKADINVFYDNTVLFGIDGRQIVVDNFDPTSSEIPHVEASTYFASWNTMPMLYDHVTTKLLTLAAGNAMLSLINLSLNSLKDKGSDKYVQRDYLGVSFKPLPQIFSKPLEGVGLFTGGFELCLRALNSDMLSKTHKSSIGASVTTYVKGAKVEINGTTDPNMSRKSVDLMSLNRRITCYIRHPITSTPDNIFTFSGN